MSIKSMPFDYDSNAADPTQLEYSAEYTRGFLSAMFTNGIFPEFFLQNGSVSGSSVLGSSFKITVIDALSIHISPGKCAIEGLLCHLDKGIVINIPSTTQSTTYDIVIQSDFNNKISDVILQPREFDGDIIRNLIRESGIYQIGIGSITASDRITSFVDQRLNTTKAFDGKAVCGIVSSIYQTDTTGVLTILEEAAKEILGRPINTDDIADKAITGEKVADLAITDNHIETSAIQTRHLGYKVVKAINIAIDAVENEKILNGAVTTEKLGTGAVTGEKIANKGITSDKIDDGAIQPQHIGDNAIQSYNIGIGAVNTDNLANKAVTSDKIDDGAIQPQHIGNNAIQSYNIGKGAVTNEKLGEGAVTGEEIANNAIQTRHLGYNIVQSFNIENGAVTPQKLAETYLPMKTFEAPQNFTDADYDTFTTPGIFLIDNNSGRHEVLTVVRPNSGAYVMQTLQRYDKTMFRGAWSSDGENFLPSDWEGWKEVGGADVGEIPDKSITPEKLSETYLPIKTFEAPQNFTDADYDTFTTPGIYQIDNPFGRHEVLTVKRTNSGALVMQILERWDETKFRGAWSNDGTTFPPEDWSPWRTTI